MKHESNLQIGERAVRAAGIDLIVAERPSTPSGKPLVVFVPGAVHLARIAYGLPGLQEQDFLAYWLARSQHPFLGISYPLALPSQPVFASVDPALQLSTLTDAIAETVAAVIEHRELPRQVIVAGWSAAGNMAPLLRRALLDLEIDLLVFAALAATPPLPNLVLGSAAAAERYAENSESFTADGLVSFRAIRSFTGELDQVNRVGGRPVLPVERYLSEVVGDMPVNLFPGLSVRHDGSSLRVDHGFSIDSAAGAGWAGYPLTAALQPDDTLDARHALTDRSNWAMINNNVIYGRLLAGVDLSALPPGRWQALVDLTDRVPDLLSRRMAGGHLFFVGRAGARATAAAVSELADQARGLSEELARIANTAVQ